jgi:hypothetical protein
MASARFSRRLICVWKIVNIAGNPYRHRPTNDRLELSSASEAVNEHTVVGPGTAAPRLEGSCAIPVPLIVPEATLPLPSPDRSR